MQKFPTFIPFNSWSFSRLDIGNGDAHRHKTATSRHNKYGKVGSIFSPELVLGNGNRITRPDLKFKLVSIRKKFLGTIALNHYYEEGAESADEFISTWKNIHKGKFDPKDQVWFHQFECVIVDENSGGQQPLPDGRDGERPHGPGDSTLE